MQPLVVSRLLHSAVTLSLIETGAKFNVQVACRFFYVRLRAVVSLFIPVECGLSVVRCHLARSTQSLSSAWRCANSLDSGHCRREVTPVDPHRRAFSYLIDKICAGMTNL